MTNCKVTLLVISLICNRYICGSKEVSEYDQEIPQSQTADKPMAPQPSEVTFCSLFFNKVKNDRSRNGLLSFKTLY